MRAQGLVLRAVSELFGQRAADAVDRYWASGYVEHSTTGRPGLDGLRESALEEVAPS
jgi:hypothetical protein